MVLPSEEIRIKKRGEGFEDHSERKEGEVSHSQLEESVRNILDEKDKRTFEYGIDIDFQLSTTLLGSIIQGLSSEDPKLQLEACEKLVFPKFDAPLPGLLFSLLDGVIEANLVSKILRFLDATGPPQLQASAAWVIATLARTDPKLIVEKGGISKLLLTLLHSQTAIQPTAYALSCLAVSSGGTERRLYVDILLKAQVIPTLTVVLMNLLDEVPMNIPTVLSMSKLLKSICYIPKNIRITEDRMDLLETVLTTFGIVDTENVEILCNTCWALYYLTKSGDEEVIEKCIHREIVPKLVRAVGQSIQRNDHKLLRPCLNVVGNIISSAIDRHTDDVISAGMLPHLKTLMLESKWSGEVNWIISNIAAGNLAQKEVNITGPKEAIYTVINVLDKGSEIHKRFFRENGTLRLLAIALGIASEILQPVVDAVYLYVRSFHTPNDDTLHQELNDSGMLLELSKLQDEKNEDIYDRVGYILDVGLNNIVWVVQPRD